MVRWSRSIIPPVASPNVGDKKYLPWKDAAMGRKAASHWREPTPGPVCLGLNIKVLLNSCCLLLENKISACLVHVGLVSVRECHRYVQRSRFFLEGADDQPPYAHFSA